MTDQFREYDESRKAQGFKFQQHRCATPQETIQLYLRDNVWLAKSDDPKVIQLFGTDTVPTPYTAQAKPDDVLRDITQRNPKAIVKFADACICCGVIDNLSLLQCTGFTFACPAHFNEHQKTGDRGRPCMQCLHRPAEGGNN